jgi:hypothetical protein
MADLIGRISVPGPPTASVTFPLRTDFGHSQSMKRNVITHQFGDVSGKVDQLFYIGPPATRYTFRKNTLKLSERKALAAFWESMRGCEGVFLYSAPQEDQTFVTKTVRFDDTPLTLDTLIDAIGTVGLTFVEIPTSSPNYAINQEVIRFPSDALAASLTNPVQEVIPLIRIRVIETAVPDIYLADRRVTVGGINYLPRLLEIGKPGTDVIVSQDIEGSADNNQYTFGNADRVMTRLANDTQLIKARLEFALFFPSISSKLNLWAGEIVNWSSDKGPTFSIQAADIISALTLQSPVRNVSRTCWRIVGDMNFGCPAPPGSTCDLGYNTPDGCLAKGGTVKHSFGGQLVTPQSVTIRDNSTGTWGFGRDLVTPTSQINDSAYGQNLSEIWHNDDGIPQRGLSVNCILVDGREESEFYDGLGIVGRGPIGAYTTARMYDSDGDGKAETFLGSTLDGQFHHGFKQTDDSGNYTDDGLGLRQVKGTDPAGANDFFSLGRVAGTPNAGEVVGGGSIYLDTFAAGVAFMEIRRTDQKGIQPSEISSHQMIAMISQGLAGLTWGSPGSRSSVPGLTNPFWVTVNTFLRSLGIEAKDAATQEFYFDVLAAAACGAVADTTVASLFGGGSESQFRFKGAIQTLKPLRDRLQEILNNCLGYYTWSFGKLKLGCRTNANPETYFSSGNMLFGSLKIDPIRPQFEKLTVEFADEEFLFKKNTADYTDLDYALRNGRVQNPKAAQIGLIGSSTKSQSARIAVIRTREELGGVGEIEQRNARIATWKTTVLGLDTEAGQVVGVYDQDLPGGFGRFRIQSWRLNRDWSIEITGKTVTDSMYDLATGNVTVGVAVVAQPTQAAIDTGPPPEPIFLGQVAPDNLMAAEVYDLHFDSTINIRTIIQGTFTFFYDDPTDPGLGTRTKVVSVAWPYDFFVITPPATTMTTEALDWVMKCELPGMHISRIDGFVTNLYSDSPTYSILVDLQLANIPKSQTGDEYTYLSAYSASTGTFTVDHFVEDVTPSGAMDGTNTIFTLPSLPIGKVALFYNGVLQVLDVDISITSSTITFLRSDRLPNDAFGESLRARYRRA